MILKVNDNQYSRLETAGLLVLINTHVIKVT